MRRFIATAMLLCISACAVMSNGSSRPYDVFFDKDSAKLDATSAGVIAQVASIARQQPGAQVVVLGYAGNVGGAKADQALSDARAKAVASQLTADGVDPTRIASQGRGQTNEDPSVARRRVEIQIRS